MKAVIYVRVSSRRQEEEGNGLDSQERVCRAHADRKNLVVERVFSDTYSGATTDRPGLNALLAYLKDNPSCVVIVDDISRLNRDLQGHLDVRQMIRESKCFLASPARSFEDDPDSIMTEKILAVFAEHHRAKNRQQVLSRMKGRLLAGEWPFSLPYGYRRVMKNGAKRIEADPVDFPIVQRMLRGFASGQLASPADALRFLNNQPEFVRKYPQGSRTIQRVLNILPRQMYSGFYDYPKYEVPLTKGNHPAAITYEEHLTIIERLTPTRKAPETNLSVDFPLKDHLVCDACGAKMTGCWSQGKRKKYPYYLCFNKKCPNARKSIGRDIIHDALGAQLHKLKPTDFATEVFRLFIRSAQDFATSGLEAELQSLESRVSRLEVEKRKLARRAMEEEDPDIANELRARLQTH
ncbi:recombinase family protein [Falsirhodobacter xinxiangensis]|uniref:recombinase family protein n=1 Tax=Falsirhodobacter xinxiangensis TaxID=2530049 RepID=UPI00145A0FB8|nr:recombinase family protein [Rhodobacter xinxiangensis]